MGINKICLYIPRQQEACINQLSYLDRDIASTYVPMYMSRYTVTKLIKQFQCFQQLRIFLYNMKMIQVSIKYLGFFVVSDNVRPGSVVLHGPRGAIGSHPDQHRLVHDPELTTVGRLGPRHRMSHPRKTLLRHGITLHGHERVIVLRRHGRHPRGRPREVGLVLRLLYVEQRRERGHARGRRKEDRLCWAELEEKNFD